MEPNRLVVCVEREGDVAWVMAVAVAWGHILLNTVLNTVLNSHIVLNTLLSIIHSRIRYCPCSCQRSC